MSPATTVSFSPAISMGVWLSKSVLGFPCSDDIVADGTGVAAARPIGSTWAYARALTARLPNACIVQWAV
jgi:hypothetical protein